MPGEQVIQRWLRQLGIPRSETRVMVALDAAHNLGTTMASGRAQVVSEMLVELMKHLDTDGVAEVFSFSNRIQPLTVEMVLGDPDAILAPSDHSGTTNYDVMLSHLADTVEKNGPPTIVFVVTDGSNMSSGLDFDALRPTYDLLKERILDLPIFFVFLGHSATSHGFGEVAVLADMISRREAWTEAQEVRCSATFTPVPDGVVTLTYELAAQMLSGYADWHRRIGEPHAEDDPVQQLVDRLEELVGSFAPLRDEVSSELGSLANDLRIATARTLETAAVRAQSGFYDAAEGVFGALEGAARWLRRKDRDS